MPHKDPERRRAYAREWARRNHGRVYTPEVRERRRLYMVAYRERRADVREAWLSENREQVREYDRKRRDLHNAQSRARYDANPQIMVNGERFRVSDLPSEWQPVARSIREARQELRKGHRKNG